MRKNRQLITTCLVEQHLFWRIDEMLFATDNMRYAHVRIVNNHDKVIDGYPVRAHNNKIIKRIARERNFSLNLIVNDDRIKRVGYSKTDNKRLIRLQRQVLTVTIVLLVPRTVTRLRTVTAVRFTLGK